MPTHNFEELLAAGYRRWYQFGVRSPEILYKRLRHKYRPIFRARMMWQRARYGFSDADAWSLNYHLARVTVGGVKKLREWEHGYPGELSSVEEWDAILAQIEEGFQAWVDMDGWFTGDPAREQQFKAGMALYVKWFGALWD